MSLSQSRRRVRVNGATLSRGQTITFERQTEAGDCKRVSGVFSTKTKCLNENRRPFAPSKFIKPSNAKPTKEDKLKGFQEIDPDCKTDKNGDKLCKNDAGNFVNITKGNTESTFKEKVKDVIVGTITAPGRGLTKLFGGDTTPKTIREGIENLKNGTKIIFSFKDTVIDFLLAQENKVRAAKVIADAVALGMITVGGIAISTGVGAGVGAGLVATGATIGAASVTLGKATDALLFTAKKIRQLENAVEVAKQVLTPKVDRNKLIEEKKEEIDNKTEELLEMFKGDLQKLAKELKLENVSVLRKSELAREVAIFQIIGDKGLKKVEPKVGKSLLEKELNEKLKKIQEEMDEILAEELEELDAEQDVIDTIGLAGEEGDKDEGNGDDTIGKPKPKKPKPKPGKPDKDEGKVAPAAPIDPQPKDTIDLDTLEIDIDEEEEKREELGEEEEGFKFSEITNENLIGKASRSKLEKAMKGGLIQKPTNFNNPTKLKGNDMTPLEKQKAATILSNNQANIYNTIVEEITNAEDCRLYLTLNKNRIDLLPKSLKSELRLYCENILSDDKEDASDVEEI